MTVCWTKFLQTNSRLQLITIVDLVTYLVFLYVVQFSSNFVKFKHENFDVHIWYLCLNIMLKENSY